MSLIREFTIATLNVHGAWGPLRRTLGDVFRSLSLDALCLQECSPGSADALCSMLGDTWRAVVAPAAYQANVILTPHPIRQKKALTLRAKEEEMRSAALAKIEVHEKRELWVCCTHLDYRAEPIRLAQWNQLQEKLPADHVLGGDLNALTRSDYGAAAWDAISTTRANNHWEPPLPDLMDHVFASGYRDSWTHGDNNGEAPTTSRFDTRIDYILLSRAFRGSFVPRSHSCIDTRSTGASDHSLVLARVRIDG